MSSEFVFPDLSKLRTREDCARTFCSMITKLLTYATKHISDSECLTVLDEMSGKYRLARDTVYTLEEITEKMGHTLMKWRGPIEAHDEGFFLNTSLDKLISDSLTDGDPPPSESINEKNRKKFARVLTPTIRTVLFDALNIMLRIYAKYGSMPQK